jgi:hypothetical protein
MGHGCDFIGDRRQVPVGCTYITLEICGRKGWELPKIYAAFRNPTLCIPLMFPEQPELFRLLKEYILSSDASEITIHHQDEEYTNSSNTFQAETPPILWKSGLYQLGNTPTLANGQIYEPLQGANLADVYNRSLIQPHVGAVLPTLHERMTTHSGIYYNFACRSPCDVATTADNVHVARALSYSQKLNKDPTYAKLPNLPSTLVIDEQVVPFHMHPNVGHNPLQFEYVMNDYEDWYAAAEDTFEQYKRIQRMINIPTLADLPNISYGFHILYDYWYTEYALGTFRPFVEDPEILVTCDRLDALAIRILPAHVCRVRSMPLPIVGGKVRRTKRQRRQRQRRQRRQSRK